ncbi:amidase [Lutibaculum baratangense]|uniref:Asp-tRNAAsn/Glu-tRNAGln amidotransferase A n=1 Tax=Lutibaculum baratangense AMV1 TaxID=631454 RepID=V4QZX9_9HYPH|nr:amidase [Lutibaculum baratangense]ESR25317.1 Asp-tRNAAsn/Glu-tRNAGln amidotransferase A [Lutibaculum baratangense AMV1]
MISLDYILEALETGETTSEALTLEALDRARDPAGEGGRAFLSLYEEAAPVVARASDMVREAGVPQGPLAGLPISIKDLFDVRGEVTKAGSRVLEDAEPAADDAPVVKRLRAAGAVLVGRTNMTEFAFSGLGLNPHYGTPLNPYDRETGRIPGGSSSGAAVSVTDGMAVAAIGSDTGGSVRIPAAMCGLTGFKPTARRVPTTGAAPLSWSLDSVGALAPTVACCTLLDSVLAGEEPSPLPRVSIEGLRLAVSQTLLLDGLDETVARSFGRAARLIADAGARLFETPLEPFGEIASANSLGGFPGAESYAWHRPLIVGRSDEYDPRVAARITRGAEQSAADFLDLQAFRKDLVGRVERELSAFDAVICPTVPVVPPELAPLEEDDELFAKTNLLVLRNPTAVNMMDGCAISIPCHRLGDPPVGLMLFAPAMHDRRLLAVARAVERVLAPLREE